MLLFLTQIGEEKVDLNSEFLFYSRPKGTYKGKDTEKLLLDFYLINTTISPEGNKVKATINDTEIHYHRVGALLSSRTSKR